MLSQSCVGGHFGVSSLGLSQAYVTLQYKCVYGHSLSFFLGEYTGVE